MKVVAAEQDHPFSKVMTLIASGAMRSYSPKMARSLILPTRDTFLY